MILSFRHKGLRLLFEQDNSRGLAPEQVRKIRQILALLDAAESMNGLGYGTFRLHPLTGDLKGSGRSPSARTGGSFSVSRPARRRTLIWSTIIEDKRTMSRMLNPPHPGEMIADSLEELGVSVTDAARGLGVTRQQLHKVISGRSAISPEMAVRLERALGSTAETYLRLQMNYDLAQVLQRVDALDVKSLVTS